MEKHEDKGEIQLAVPGLGERLRSARMACNLDMAKLAARIHLTSDVVEALERDDYSEMPARVFVRGYVRNYARAVNLPSESVLAQFDRQWPEEDYQVHFDESPRLAADPHSHRRWPGLVTWLVVMVVVGLTLIWWQGYLDRYVTQWQDGTATTQVTAPSEQPAGTVAGEQAESAVSQTLNGEPPMPVSDNTHSLALPLPPVTASASEPESPPASTSETAGESAGETPAEQVASTPAAETVTAESPVRAASPVASEAVSEPTGALPQVVVRFLGDSWVDIRDSQREYKLVGIMKRGTERRLGGTPPYTVVLGNAHAVELRVNGEPYDLTRHTRRNVARFTLEP
jgi:cytoskeleton protein RodZ